LSLHRAAEAVEPAERQLALRKLARTDDDADDIAAATADLGAALVLSGKDTKRGRKLLREAHELLEKAGERPRLAIERALLQSTK
jgi:hypothetical protein